MEKRIVIFVVFAFLVLMWSSMSRQTAPVRRPGATSPQAVQPTVTAVPAAAALNTPGPKTAEKTMEFEAEPFTATIATRSGVLQKFILKKYLADKNPIDLCPDSSAANGLACANLALRSDSLAAPLDFTVEQSSPQQLVLKAKTGIKSLWVRKTFAFDNKDYLFSYKISFQNTSQQAVDVPSFYVDLGPGIGTFKNENNLITAVTKIGDSVNRSVWGTSFLMGAGRFLGLVTGPEPTFKETRMDGKVALAALKSRYFGLALIPDFFTTGALIVTRPGNATQVSVGLPPFKLPARGVQEFSFQVFGGPLGYSHLKSLHLSLENMVDLGYFSSIAVIMLYTLEFFNHITHNYGLAIILLTILVKFILWWPTQKSFESMRKMQRLQPQINALKAKYKDDSTKLNAETMKLFKEQKVNPMGGCLPMLIQMPVFFALYLTLSSSIQLRGAPFCLWIQDLSVKDPYFVLPILMGVTMLLQQWMSSPDPAQFKSTLWLPLIFMATFFWLPSGVLLYWVVQNILSVGQQALINRKQTV